MHNGQNSNSTTVHNTPYNYNLEEVASNPFFSCRYSAVVKFGTANLTLLNCTSSATENSSIDQRQPLIIS